MLTKSQLREKVYPFVKRFAGIAHIHRLSLLYLLAHDSLEIRELTAATGLLESLVVHHMKALTAGGWVKREHYGRTTKYHIQEKAFHELERLFGDTPFGRDVLIKNK